jgi:hypothetical protein
MKNPGLNHIVPPRPIFIHPVKVVIKPVKPFVRIPNPCQLESVSTKTTNPELGDYNLPKSVLAYFIDKPIQLLEIETFSDYTTGNTECTITVRHGRKRAFVGYATLGKKDVFDYFTGIDIAVLKAVLAIIEFYR